MNKRKRIVGAALAAALLLTALAGCGRGAQDPAPGGASATPDPAALVWSADFAALSGGPDYLGSAAVSGDWLFLTGSVTDEASGEYRSVLLRAAADGAACEPLAAYAPPAIPEGMEGAVDVSGLCAAPDGGIWVYERVNTYSFDLPADFAGDDEARWDYYVEGESVELLRRLDETGAELLAVDVSDLAGDSPYFYIQALAADAEGNLYITDGDATVWAYGPDGTPLFTLPLESWARDLVTLADGRVALFARTGGGYALLPIDAQARGFGEALALEDRAERVYPGAGDYAFFYSAASTLFGYSAETGESTALFSFLSCDVNEDEVMVLLAREDGSFRCLCFSYASERTELATLTQQPASALPQKTVLTMAVMYLDQNLRQLILDFNRASGTHRIEVLDYSQYNTDEDYQAGLTRLNTEIITGDVPDILLVDDLPVAQYAAKGLLEDLYPYIDADPELSRDSFFPSILAAIETDGKLFQLAPAFSVVSLLGRSDVVGEDMGWTVEELMAVYAAQPEGTALLDQSVTCPDILQILCMTGFDSYVDWEAGTCSFDSQSFVDLLTFCAQFPETYEYSEANYESTPSRVTSGKQLLAAFSAGDFEEIQMYEAMFGGEVTFKGFPTAEGVGNVAALSGALAISAGCADKAGAWDFLRRLLVESYFGEDGGYYYVAFPMNRAAFDKAMAAAMEKTYYTDPETGEQVEQSHGGWSWDGFEVTVYAMTEAQAEDTLALIDSVSALVSYDQSIMDIVTENAAAFFAGERSAEDAAKIIQSSVALYVSEQG